MAIELNIYPITPIIMGTYPQGTPFWEICLQIIISNNEKKDERFLWGIVMVIIQFIYTLDYASKGTSIPAPKFLKKMTIMLKLGPNSQLYQKLILKAPLRVTLDRSKWRIKRLACHVLLALATPQLLIYNKRQNCHCAWKKVNTSDPWKSITSVFMSSKFILHRTHMHHAQY